jgi:type II secretory pathway pseudopilin PulG
MKKNNFSKAFTIIEIVVAIAILGIGVISIAMFFAKSAQVARSASNLTSASNLAQAVLEEQLAVSYDELIEGTSAQTKISSDPTSPYYIFEKKVTISCVNSTLATVNCALTPAPMKKIEVFIYYQEGTTQKNVQIATLQTEK